jgi:hypothetical protein
MIRSVNVATVDCDRLTNALSIVLKDRHSQVIMETVVHTFNVGLEQLRQQRA